mgnify:CR=1 FL=1
MPRHDGELYGGAMDLVEHLQPLASLVGRWTGEGAGEYPTISTFRYRKELVVADVGRQFLTWQERTWSLVDHRPMFTSTGFVRVPGPERVELRLALPTGLVECCEGTVDTTDGLRLELPARVLGSQSAKPVTATSRTLVVTGDQMEMTMDMAAMGRPIARHLTCALTRS